MFTMCRNLQDVQVVLAAVNSMESQLANVTDRLAAANATAQGFKWDLDVS